MQNLINQLKDRISTRTSVFVEVSKGTEEIASVCLPLSDQTIGLLGQLAVLGLTLSCELSTEEPNEDIGYFERAIEVALS
jgi:hypothetical protein